MFVKVYKVLTTKNYKSKSKGGDVITEPSRRINNRRSEKSLESPYTMEEDDDNEGFGFSELTFAAKENTSSSVSNEELVSFLNSHESKFKGLVQGLVTELHENMDNIPKTVHSDLTEDVLFEERLLNYRYKIMITLSFMIKSFDDKYVTDKKVYLIAYVYLKNYIDCYLVHLGVSDFEITKVYKTLENTIDNVDMELYEDGEILWKPLGVLFQGNKIKEK
ncbi:unnamed protein product [Lactuca saligna]|uniref:Uncharacterized protein n=1 Tax=Lactuca saligna TaxID=75948 RepID=A0AA35YLM1_LACSI|nr:unnamed protein product [Lactuca saligna]